MRGDRGLRAAPSPKGPFPEAGWWRKALDWGRFSDTMLLEQFVQLAEGRMSQRMPL
jgi:hypothetical protein